jgi:gentisate 1,2-dioxygenase
VKKPIETAELREFYAELERKHLVPLWNITGELFPGQPRTKLVPFLWRWKDFYPLALRAGELVPIERGGERRVLSFVNPSIPEKYSSTNTLWGALQILLPGETAPAHRHSPAAIRFIVQGQGAYTTVDGEKCVMARGDLVLTPAWMWHDHGNETDEPMLWMDGLDLPLVQGLDAMFFEPYAELRQAFSRPANESERRYGIGQLKPAWEPLRQGASPLLNYKWEQTYNALKNLAQIEASPFDDVVLEYINPHTGGPVLPTLGCAIQLLRPGVHTQAHRHTGSVVYHAFEGSGSTIMNGQRFDWSKGDFFVLPPWACHEHINPNGREAILFSVNDFPVIKAFGLYREQPYEKDGGHQQVTSVFEG